MQEIETKILEVDPEVIEKRLNDLGAKKILTVRFSVDWFAPKGEGKGFREWYLRIRRRSDGIAEVTWKGNMTHVGIVKSAREIHFETQHPEKMEELFFALGLMPYAHQGKDRTSWTFKQWRFDLDQYPGIPPYLEIEGTSEAHIREAIALLGIEHHEVSNEGERTIIENHYHRNWSALSFE